MDALPSKRSRRTAGLGPSLDRDASAAGITWVRRVLSHDTASSSDEDTPDRTAWEFIRCALTDDRLTGLALCEIALGLPATESQFAEVTKIHTVHTAFDLLAESVLGDIQQLLAGTGIEWRLLKGLASAHLWYSSPDLRHTADVDLLVHDSDFYRSIELLNSVGPLAVVHRGPASAQASNQMTFVHPSGVEIDLHRWVTGFLPAYRIDERHSWEQPQTVQLAWGSASAMSADMMALHVLLHLTCHSVRLSSVADLLQALCRDDVDWERVVALSSGLGSRMPIWWAIDRATTWVDPVRVEQLMKLMRPNRPLEWAGNRVLDSPQARRLLFHVTSPRRTRRFIESTRPSREFVDWKAGS